ncbi:MAG TPA: hypothetical protein VFJ14_08130 [Nocardioidaceae bacterium]|nr:hypothetical protein [Nocardioidaceae bacterium]
MPDWNDVDRSHVLTAIAECDRLGSKEFLRRHGFGRAKAYMLWHRGEEYDSKAILGVAYLHATGRPATSEQFPEGEDGAAELLRELGFDVVAQEEPAAPSPRKAARPKPRKTAAKEPVVKVCPRCHMALPASGVCDYCD